MFNDIVLAVEAIHRADIQHRDIKPDNLKARDCNPKKVTVAIDFGTAARSTTTPLLNSYENQVGDSRYSSPESLCGLAGHRDIGQYSDIFSLGCILFELFDYREYWKVFLDNPSIIKYISYLRAATLQTKDVGLRLSAYNKAIAPIRRAAPQPIFEIGKTTAPSCIIDLLNNVLRKLTSFDYRQRVNNLKRVRIAVNSMLRVVDNQRLQAHRLAQKRLMRENRRQKLLEREERIERLRLENRD